MAKETVLVADADPRSLRLVEMALRRAGFAVVVAATGEEAMRALAGARPQAMMVDAALPAPDGIALCRAARGEERLAGVVILVLGTDAAPAAKAQAVEAGAGGEAAFWRLMTWESGEFRVDFGAAAREPRIHCGTQAAMMESMRRIDELGRMVQETPLEAQLAVDVVRLEARLSDLPDDLNGVLRSFDGVRTLRAAIDLSPMDDLATMAAVDRLLREGILRPLSRPASLQQWVSASPLPVAAEPSVPRIVNFPAIRGMRRERLPREKEQARARNASGEPLRPPPVGAPPPPLPS